MHVYIHIDTCNSNVNENDPQRIAVVAYILILLPFHTLQIACTMCLHTLCSMAI